MVELMSRLLAPRIVSIINSSLLNTTEKGGIFKGYVNMFDLVIGDEGLRIPEPVFMAIASRLESWAHPHRGRLPVRTLCEMFTGCQYSLLWSKEYH
ncbi:hypothetical protein Y032_0568g60 [Ancylostoma ceylanicum]|uniref:Uncharacterized protein n=1 Tax=Ancylostoma ceylanicum TaxID=53326 RepID=A0A016WP93_9BILA|nr:hypothetical protein Y032_0568g60 [Ancylostoma ceylanicum]